jgi:periplasmic protein CpxP/Spy
MKRIAFPFTRSKLPVAVAVFFALALLIVGPSSPGAKGPGAAAANGSEGDRVETAIKDLHSKLKITDKQEKQWSKVAQVMRDNAKTMDGLMKTRLEKAKAMNAVEDLKSYGEVTDAHAAGIKKFISVFEPLYTGMSDEQKRDADLAFKAPDQQQKTRRK